MDTISRENNSMLPIGGVIVGVLGLLLGAYSVMAISKVKNQLADDQPKIEKIDEIASQASTASSTASSVKNTLDTSLKQIQDAFNGVGNTLGTINAQLAKLEESAKAAPGKKGAKGAAAEVVAGPGEYVVKPHDTSTKIAAANGCTRAQLLAVNPGINWAKLKPGQKLKLPEKKPAA
jgi:LysM repeat protein